MLRLTLVNSSIRSGVVPRLFGQSCSIFPKTNAVSNFSSASKGLLRPRAPNQTNNQFLRKYSRGDRTDAETTRSHLRNSPTLKERMMAPPSENGKAINRSKYYSIS